MTTPTITDAAERRRTVAVATTGTVLALIAYTTPVGTLAATASGLGAGAQRAGVDLQLDELRSRGGVAARGCDR